MSARHLAAISALVAGPIAIASSVVILAAVEWDAGIFSDATRLLEYGAEAADAARVAMVLDIFGYYLLAIPAVLALYPAWVQHSPLNSRIATFCAAGYALGGAAGAAVLSAVWPAALLWSGEPGSEIAAHVLLTEAVTKGVWNLLGSTLLAVWFVLLGQYLWRHARALAVFTGLLGAASGLDAVFTAVGASELAAIPLQVYLYGWPVWAIWLGVNLLRGRAPIATTSTTV